MATFQSVNSGMGSKDHTIEIPKASQGPDGAQQTPSKEESNATTPTRNSFQGTSNKRTLPISPFSSSFPQNQTSTSQDLQGSLNRGDSHRSTGSQDVDMDDSDDDVSDTESMDDETGRPSKKKKGQRFFCSDYPPCNLSFTRSEHLARHIRKHTGERPFQCHCARRFSRLDNLRQHAQTVHVNEEIPGDSLAATGTRFQRQIRTDRVRPPGARSRASTASSQGSHHTRGHSRNLSASSIGSTTSTLSTISTISRDDTRRRPQPLMMAHDSSTRARLTIETMGQSSPGMPSTPTSTAYSTGPTSPFGSALGSPISGFSRQVGLWDGRASHGRRLSVPSGVSPFPSSHSNLHASPHLGPLSPSNASHTSNYSSVMASPTSSTYSFSRQDSAAAEADWRRRTWHPSTYSNYQRPATSGLSYYQTPDAPRPAFGGQPLAAASQGQRLPGIETFDQITHRPVTPPRQGVSAMQVDPPKRPSLFSGSSDRSISGLNDRRGHASWDLSLHQNLTKLDIANGTPPKDTAGQWGKQAPAETQTIAPKDGAGQWGMQAIAEIQNVAGASGSPSSSQPSHPAGFQDPPKRLADFDHYRQPVTPQREKRSGWYHGPPPSMAPAHQPTTAQRTSPEDSSSSEGVPTPSTSIVDFHPSIVHANGYIETNHTTPGTNAGFVGYHTSSNTQPHTYTVPSEPIRSMATPKGPDMSGLEALVAVATSEEKAQTTARH